MKEEEWRTARNSRSLRYAQRVLDPRRWIVLRAGRGYLSRYDGQVALLTAANLFARMTPAVALDIPAVRIAPPLPWAGQELRAFTIEMMLRADPYGKFESRAQRDGDCLVHLGPSGAPSIAHGSGWNIYLGPEPSPLPQAEAANPIGPAMAAIIATASAFKTNLEGAPEAVLLNSLNWQPEIVQESVAELSSAVELGEVWTAGTGSVGTAILYFLTLATRSFSNTLFDMDVVGVHNLDRSPVFTHEQVEMAKAKATEAWLRGAGISNVRSEPRALDESVLWQKREAGTPDILIAAANERNVRSVIETGFPPIQVYGTTGQHWQAAIMRHVPMKDPCSSCLFPATEFAATECATGEVAPSTGEERMDAALPFLSFAAGAMAAAEILKLSLPGYPFTPNRVILNTQPSIGTVRASLVQREGCHCQQRSQSVHRRMIAGTRFAGLS
ncbi:MAG: hypothetical protein CMQ43_01570 [Gammaproteobacteria bacterium]|nr:hypothetical protein [Gammaproteobacteria bacterium]|tara:strand:+ start:3694 stop:5022 length:1329 start_codon:yes stop_codon:yes gene_type:complete